MLRCLMLLAFPLVLSLTLCAQSVGAPIATAQEAEDPMQTHGAEIGIRTKAPWSAYRFVLVSRAVGKDQLGKAPIVSKPASGQEGAQQSLVRTLLKSEESAAWFRRKMISEKSILSEAAQKTTITANGQDGFHWAAALKQSLLFLGVQHGYAMTQAKTRRELRGPFFKDYFRSVSNLGGWDDGGRFFTNYISHPMEGSIAGFIQIQNDPKGIKQEFGKSRGYWTSRLKSMAWNAAYSTQFEIGPISQSSIGNVGLHTSLNGKKRKMAYVDLVVTPTLGTAWLIGEDFLDRFVVQRLEMKANRQFMRNAARVLLNPMRGAANMLRFKTPWYRDR